MFYNNHVFNFFSSPKKFVNDRLQETSILLDTFVSLCANIKPHLKLYQVEVLCRLMECLTITIDLQMKGIDLEKSMLEHENDHDKNLSKQYQLSDIGKMLSFFEDVLSLVDDFMNKRLSAAFYERSWDTELQVSNVSLVYL